MPRDRFPLEDFDDRSIAKLEKRLKPQQAEASVATAEIAAKHGTEKAAQVMVAAMLESIYATGIRTGELLRLKIPDFDAKARTIFVRQGKGGKDRIIPLPSTA